MIAVSPEWMVAYNRFNCFYSPEGKKYQMAKDWRIPVVNVLWLSDLILGHMDALKLPIHNKYLQVGHGDEFVMDMNKVQHLLSKTTV